MHSIINGLERRKKRKEKSTIGSRWGVEMRQWDRRDPDPDPSGDYGVHGTGKILHFMFRMLGCINLKLFL
jgi:hypothetical protein